MVCNGYSFHFEATSTVGSIHWDGKATVIWPFVSPRLILSAIRILSHLSSNVLTTPLRDLTVWDHFWSGNHCWELPQYLQMYTTIHNVQNKLSGQSLLTWKSAYKYRATRSTTAEHKPPTVLSPMFAIVGVFRYIRLLIGFLVLKRLYLCFLLTLERMPVAIAWTSGRLLALIIWDQLPKTSRSSHLEPRFT